MNRRSVWLLAIVFGGFFLLFLIFVGVAFAALRGQERTEGPTGGPKLGVVVLKGVIGAKGGIEGRREAEQIYDFARDDEIKGIVVRVDSPGGAVAPSQELNEEIRRAEKKKKVVCSMGNLAASGGYYVSVACDEIVADPGTLTGSIGVISQLFAVPDLLSAAKVQETTLKTGALKDAGSPFRPITDQDKAYLNGLIHDIYQQFVAAVAAGRHKKVADILPLADGRVYTGEEAQKLGLIDKIGNFRTAVDELMRLSKLHGEPQLVYPVKRNRFLDFLRGDARAAAREATEGAVEGLEARGGLQPGILLLAPGLGSR